MDSVQADVCSAQRRLEKHGRQVLLQLQKQLGGKLCNVSLSSKDGKKFSCHKSMLAANSPVLDATVAKSSKSDKCQIQLEFNANIVEQLVQYFYSGTAQINEFNCVELLQAAASLSVVSLEDEVKLFIGRIAQGRTREFLKSDLFMSLPPKILDETLSDVLVNIVISRRESVLDLVKALAEWTSVEHATRSETNMKLIKRIKNAKAPMKQLSCQESGPGPLLLRSNSVNQQKQSIATPLARAKLSENIPEELKNVDKLKLQNQKPQDDEDIYEKL